MRNTQPNGQPANDQVAAPGRGRRGPMLAVVVALVTTLSALAASAPATSATSTASTSVAPRQCAKGPLTTEVLWTRVKTPDSKVLAMRVRRGKGGWSARARVRLSGAAGARVKVVADACPGGVANPEAAQSTMWWVGSRTATRRGAAVTRSRAEAMATQTVRRAVRAAMERSIVRQTLADAKAAALEKSAGTTTDPTPTPPTPPTPEQIETYRNQVRAAVLKYTNIERAKVGAGPLTTLGPITNSAQKWAQSLADRGVLEHAPPQGILNNPGVEACSSSGDYDITEIIVGPGGVFEWSAQDADYAAEALVKTWVASSGHYALMVDADYSRTGIGIGMAPLKRNPETWGIWAAQRPWAGQCPQITS